MDKESARGFTGWWIPVEWKQKYGMSSLECLLLGEIHALSHGPYGCIASNEHFAEHLGITVGGVANMLTRLRKLKIVETESFDGRYRRLVITEPAFIGELRQTSSGDEGSGHRSMTINKKRKQKVNEPKVVDFEEPELQQEWEAWQTHRRQAKHPITAVARERQLAKLRAMGTKRALAALRHSIENNWAGIFEPREQKGTAPPMPRQHRENRINYLNRRKAELMRGRQSPEVQRELARIQIELHKL